MISKTICLDTLVNHKCQHLKRIEIHFNIHEHALAFVFRCLSCNKCPVELTANYHISVR